jgi:hypothetical protein
MLVTNDMMHVLAVKEHDSIDEVHKPGASRQQW